jgi:hypothetical protein
MPAEEFALLKREDLTEAGRELYDREVERRGSPEWAALQERKEAEYAKWLEAREKARLTGILGSPLALVALWLILGGPVVYGIDLWQVLSLLDSEREAIASLVSFMVVADVVCILAIIPVAISFFGKRRRAPKLMIGLLLLQLGGAIAGSLIAGSTDRMTPTFMETVGERTMGVLAVCIFWIPYFLFSKRVRRTFVL